MFVKNQRKTFARCAIVLGKIDGHIENPEKGPRAVRQRFGWLAATPLHNPSATPVNKAMMSLEGRQRHYPWPAAGRLGRPAARGGRHAGRALEDRPFPARPRADPCQVPITARGDHPAHGRRSLWCGSPAAMVNVRQSYLRQPAPRRRSLQRSGIMRLIHPTSTSGRPHQCIEDLRPCHVLLVRRCRLSSSMTVLWPAISALERQGATCERDREPHRRASMADGNLNRAVLAHWRRR